MRGRLPTLSHVAETAAFQASESAGAMTATVVNLTAGRVSDQPMVFSGSPSVRWQFFKRPEEAILGNCHGREGIAFSKARMAREGTCDIRASWALDKLS